MAILPRAAVVGEAMVALVLADQLLVTFGGDTIGDLRAAVTAGVVAPARRAGPDMTALAVLLGHGIGYSASPAIHNAAFASLFLDARYELRDVGADNLAAEVEALRSPTASART